MSQMKLSDVKKLAVDIVLNFNAEALLAKWKLGDCVNKAYALNPEVVNGEPKYVNAIEALSSHVLKETGTEYSLPSWKHWRLVAESITWPDVKQLAEKKVSINECKLAVFSNDADGLKGWVKKVIAGKISRHYYTTKANAKARKDYITTLPDEPKGDATLNIDGVFIRYALSPEQMENTLAHYAALVPRFNPDITLEDVSKAFRSVAMRLKA